MWSRIRPHYWLRSFFLFSPLTAFDVAYSNFVSHYIVVDAGVSRRKAFFPAFWVCSSLSENAWASFVESRGAVTPQGDQYVGQAQNKTLEIEAGWNKSLFAISALKWTDLHFFNFLPCGRGRQPTSARTHPNVVACDMRSDCPVSYTHLTLPTNREV